MKITKIQTFFGEKKKKKKNQKIKKLYVNIK